MKKYISAFAVFLSLSVVNSAQAAETCAAKREAIEQEIQSAEKYGNSYKLAGLQKALDEVKTHCTAAGVKADAQKDVSKLEQKLANKQNDIKNVTQDLKRAEEQGKSKKVEKYQKKLAEKTAELQEIQKKLDEARIALSVL